MERSISPAWEDYHTVPAREYSYGSRSLFDASEESSRSSLYSSNPYNFSSYMPSTSASVLGYQSSGLSETFFEGMSIDDEPATIADDDCSTELASLVNLVRNFFLVFS